MTYCTAMLVIHPKDCTTAMLASLYDGVAGVRLMDQSHSNAAISRALNHTPHGERVMLLGHGSDKGLFSRIDDSADTFDRIIVSHQHAYYLRRHGCNIVAVWCNADKFAISEGLHGLFSGMIVTEMHEAAECGIVTTEEELRVEGVKLVRRLRQLLDECVPLCEVPRRIAALDDAHTPLTAFNYQNFYYI